ncbi:MAG: GntR family transcriptional regulator [Deltaproteobacteria bacterium]|nr:GntR family transcriptional regulator [Deltaproteobacteria bacterium]
MGNYKNNKGENWDRVEVKSLMTVVLDTIRRRILSGEFRPGQKINESEIAINLGISRSPVREAFRILERDGLITTLPRKGSYITDISLKDLEELFEIRKILECYALDCIKKKANKSPDKIKSMIEELEKNLLKKHDPFSVISGFHYSLVEFSNNSRLIELYKILAVSLRRYWLIYHSKKGQQDISLEHHQGIVNILKKGDYTGTKTLLKKHIHYVKGVVEKKVKEILSS